MTAIDLGPPSPVTFNPNPTISSLQMPSTHLGGPNPTRASLSDEQLKIVRIIAVTSGSISMIAGLIVLHWFMRMKRGFRHQLIMMLIICDTFKAFWAFLFPAVALADINVATGSNFCTASGFFFSMGIEASDFCILLIAIHSALCIFMPRTGPMGKSGLYRYRYAVYGILICIPVLLASLAFVNNAPAYVGQTTWCYLPVRPFWFRLALAWIPRYCIILAITGLYLSIYIYVKVTFRAYRARFKTTDFNTDSTQPSQAVSHNHSAGSRRGSGLSVLGATFKVPKLSRKEEDIGLESAGARSRGFSAQDIEKTQTDLEIGPTPESSADESDTLTSQRAQGPKKNVAIGEETHSQDLRNDSRRGTDSTNRTVAPTVRLEGLEAVSPTQENEEELRKRQYAIQRQLRFMFIYPCVYVLIWLIPLINHSLQYYERFAARPSFPLICLSAVAVPIQGFVDCLLFSLREKPWRLVRKRTQQPFVSWVLRRHWEEPSREDLNIEAMSDVQRHAYLRREREKLENETAKEERQERKKRFKMVRKNSMTWWDTYERGGGGGENVDSISRQSSRHDGAEGGDGKPISRDSSYTSFGSIGRRRSRSGSDSGWRGFTFDGSSRPKLIRHKSDLANIPICAIEEENSPATNSTPQNVSTPGLGTSESNDKPEERV